MRSGLFAPKVFLLIFLTAIAAGIYIILSGAENYAKAAYYNSLAVKTQNDPTVYVVQNVNYKIAVPNSNIFLSYGFKWQDIKIVSDAELLAYKNTNYIRLVNSKNIYKFEQGGEKRQLSSDAVSFLNLNANSALVVSRSHFDFIKTGTNFTKGDAEKNNFFVGPSFFQNLNLPAEQAQGPGETAACVPDEKVGGKDGCIIYEAYIKNNVSLCSTIASGKWQSLCYSSFIPESGDFLANCKKIIDPAYVYDCYAAVAAAKKDSGICAQVSNAEKKGLCLMNVGIVLKDFTACNYAPEGKVDSCYFSYALIHQDQSACDRISQASEYKINCANLAKKQ